MPNGIHLKSQSYTVEIDAQSNLHQICLLRAIEQALKESEYACTHRFNSFAPMRPAVDQKYTNWVG